jgi:ATP-dependent helicase Lhr and Lhr-like helicase
MAELSRRVTSAFYGSFSEMRAIQERALPLVLGGADVLLISGTGSGKTEAAAAPLVERYLARLQSEDDGVVLLYISPTRALANDLARRLTPAFDALGIKLGVQHGERSDLDQAAGPRVLITTPESLDVRVGKKHARLADVAAVVLDEIHLLINTQRGLQLALVLSRLEDLLGQAPQLVALSATVAEPPAVARFFCPGRDGFEIVEEPGSNREHRWRIRIDVDRTAMAELMGRLSAGGGHTKALVFTNSRRECDALADALRTGTPFGESVFAHHSSLDREARLTVERLFEESPHAVCVATSTLELGIDIGDIDLVVLYGVPADWQSFLQRVGRAGRRATVTEALCAVPPDLKGRPLRVRDWLGFQGLIRQVRTDLGAGVGARRLYGAVVQQFVSHVHAGSGGYCGINQFRRMSQAWDTISDEDVDDILGSLVESNVFQRHPVYNRYGASDQLWEYASERAIWSNFPVSAREVDVVSGQNREGRLPSINRIRLDRGSVIAFRGRRWTVEAIMMDRIEVRPTEEATTVELQYGRRGAPLDPSLAEQLRLVILEGSTTDHVVPESKRRVLSTMFGEIRPLVEDGVYGIGPGAGTVRHVTFAGGLANQVLALWAGGDPKSATELSFEAPSVVDFSRLPQPGDLVGLVHTLEFETDDLTIWQRLLPPQLLRREFEDLWLAQPTHERVLARLRASRPIAMPENVVQLLGT